MASLITTCLKEKKHVKQLFRYSGAQPFYRSGKIFEQKSPLGKNRDVKHHEGQKSVWFTPILVTKA